MKYQLIILGPNASQFETLLRLSLDQSFTDLGLDPSTHLEVIYEHNYVADVDWRTNPVGVWFGGDPAVATPPLNELISRQAPVLPLVQALAQFTADIPPELRAINGRRWDDSRVPGDVLRALRLTRDLRQAFISYKRSDSQGVANGLLDALTRHGYRTFLDIASVEALEPFQDILWDRLSDMDLLVLIDTPGALSSRWVDEELTRANQLGLGVLQLVWPGHTPFAGTELSERLQLQATDFEGGVVGAGASLTLPATNRVLQLAEQLRIRSLATRRARVVDELASLGQQHAFTIISHPTGPLTVHRQPNNALAAVVLPLIGLPDAWSIHQAEQTLNQLQAPGVDIRLVYDNLGILAARAVHLHWLNTHLPLRTLSLDRRSVRTASPLDAWLATL